MNITRCNERDGLDLCKRFHGYGGTGGKGSVCFSVNENGRVVAFFQFKPPAPGASKRFGPSAPHGVLSLSRMVAVPRDERELKKLSKALRALERIIDRGRWPVIVSYSDSSLGHTGHVYKCAGWTAESSSRARFYTVDGVRVSSYSGGKTRIPPGSVAGETTLTAWVHRACERGGEAEFMRAHGWTRRAIPGKTWASGNQAYAIVKA